jgi:hypothetical protein
VENARIFVQNFDERGGSEGSAVSGQSLSLRRIIDAKHQNQSLVFGGIIG